MFSTILDLYTMLSPVRQMRFGLFDFQFLHEPAVLLRRQLTHFLRASWPLVYALLQTLVEQNESILLPIQRLHPVTLPSAEQKRCIAERIQLELLLHQRSQAVASLAEIRVPTVYILFVGSGEIT